MVSLSDILPNKFEKDIIIKTINTRDAIESFMVHVFYYRRSILF